MGKKWSKKSEEKEEKAPKKVELTKIQKLSGPVEATLASTRDTTGDYSELNHSRTTIVEG